MISARVMKSHTSEHTVHGRPTLTDVKRFRNGSVCKAYERAINERTLILYHRSYQPGLSLFNVIKSIFRSVIVFLDVIVNQAGSQHELRTSEQQEQKG